ncbi:MAG: hypothetical protein GKR77_01515, partial [Legionellales bacterium]|nr:hypothetical protein [Legionellales bacterium]
NQLHKQSKSVWDQWLVEQWQQSMMVWQALIESLQQAQQWQAAYAQLLQPVIDFVRQWRAHPQPGEFALQTLRQWQSNAQPLPWQQARQQLMTLTQSVAKTDAQSILYAVLAKPIDQVQQWVMQHVQQFIDRRWQVDVVNVYQQTMANRFPFSAATLGQASEISLKQLTQFLQPEAGLVWQFYQQYYLPIQSLLPVSSQWRLLMHQLKQIRELFFSTQTSRPHLNLEILPTPHPQLQELRWVHGQQQGRYQNEPQQWQTLRWPPQGTPRLTLMSGRLLNEHWVHSPTFEGVWGLFRWLSTATITSVDEQTLQVRWKLVSTSLSPLTVTLFLRAANQTQAIVTLLTTPWQFPTGLFNESLR